MTGLAAFTAALTLFGFSCGGVTLLLVRAVTWHGWMRPLLPGLALLAWSAPLTGVLCLAAYVVAVPAYPWAAEPALSGYLSPLWTGVRLGLVVIWTALFGMLGASGGLGRPLGCVGLIGLVLLVSIAAVDWTLSLQPHMKSGEFGLILHTGWVIQALAVLCAAGSGVWPERARAVWGAVLLVLCALWVYLEFMQYLVIWGPSLPPQAEWVLARTRPPWAAAAWSVGVLHIVIPALLLGPPMVRAKPAALLLAALSVLAARCLETVLWTLPSAADGTGDHAVALGLAAALVALLAALGLVVGVRRREARHG